MAKVAFLLTAALLLGLASVSHAIQGTATFYTTYNPSACYGNQDNGRMIAAESDELWPVGRRQDMREDVHGVGGTNPVPNPCHGGTITVKIVDHCPGCNGTLDRSREAFAAIGNPVARKIVVDYNQV